MGGVTEQLSSALLPAARLNYDTSLKSHNAYFFLQCRAGSTTSHSSSNDQRQRELRKRQWYYSQSFIFKYSYVWMGQNKSIPTKKYTNKP